MRTDVFAAAAIDFTAALAVRFVDDRLIDEAAPLQEDATPQPATLAVAHASWAREVRITASSDHHFYVNANVNRAGGRFLVDTGASYVALRDSDANSFGIFTTPNDFSFPVRTANGETKAAMVTIDEIDIEGIRLDGVRAFVLQDDQLAVNLLGMSFLSRLESVEARGRELILRG